MTPRTSLLTSLTTKGVFAFTLLCSTFTSRAFAQVNFPEVEANDNNATAQVVNCIANTDTITGVTSGTSTTTAGLASSDNFRVTTCATAAGIYRNRFSLSNGSATGSGGSLRGFSQSAGVINTTSDSAFQTGSGSGTIASPRLNAWYSFGAAAEVYYRVTGATATSASPYTATFTQTPVSPFVVVTTLNPGPITVSSVGSTTTDTDFWVYDSSFLPVATFGNDDQFGTSSSQSIATRTLTPGVYYVGLSNFNCGNDQSSPADDDFRGGGAMPFAGTFANSSTTTFATINFTLSDGFTTIPVAGTKPAGFDVFWAQFTVILAPPANDNCASATAMSGSGSSLGNTTLATNDGAASCDPGGVASRDVWFSFTAGTTGGTLALDTCTTTAIDSVLSVYDSCGGLELACNDDCGGSPCAATASCVGTLTLAPNQVIKIRVSDKGLTGGAFTLNRTYVPVPANNDCANATAATGTVTVSGTTVLATNDGHT